MHVKPMQRPFALRAWKAAVTLVFCALAACFASATPAFAEVYPQQDNANSFRYANGELMDGCDIQLESSADYEEYLPRLCFDGYELVGNKNGGVTFVDGAIAMGVDVSSWNEEIDWEAAKADGVRFAIIRVGYGSDYISQDDEYFERNASECERLGIPYGVYIYSYAKNEEMADSEADHTLRLIEGHNLSFPVYYDMEDERTLLRACDYDPERLSELAQVYCSRIEEAGYEAGVYANLNWWNNYLTDEVFENWDRWVAQYSNACTYSGDYSLWQCTSGGRIDGIDSPTDDEGGRADINFMYAKFLPDDVGEDDWYVDSGAYTYVTTRGYMGGYSFESFGPNDALTRGMVATILWRMAGCPDVSDMNGFDDVVAGDYYYEAVLWAQSLGVVTGYIDDEGVAADFGPNDLVTRQDLAAMLERYARLNDGLDTSCPIEAMYSKVGASLVSEHAVAGMAWAVDTGIIQGVNGTDLDAVGNTTRAQMAQIVQRYSRWYLDNI